MQQKISLDNLPQLAGSTVVILQSKWYKEQSDTMIKKCKEVLVTSGVDVLGEHLIPGALELPIAAQTIARSAYRPDAIICFGAVVKGQTYHFDIVANESARGLTNVSLSEGIPIISEILCVMDLDQLAARTADNDMNKGIEAAVAAIEMIHWRKQNA